MALAVVGVAIAAEERATSAPGLDRRHAPVRLRKSATMASRVEKMDRTFLSRCHGFDCRAVGPKDGDTWPQSRHSELTLSGVLRRPRLQSIGARGLRLSNTHATHPITHRTRHFAGRRHCRALKRSCQPIPLRGGAALFNRAVSRLLLLLPLTLIRFSFFRRHLQKQMRTTTLLLVAAASLVSCQYGGGQGGACEAELRRRQQEYAQQQALRQQQQAYAQQQQQQQAYRQQQQQQPNTRTRNRPSCASSRRCASSSSSSSFARR